LFSIVVLLALAGAAIALAARRADADGPPAERDPAPAAPSLTSPQAPGLPLFQVALTATGDSQLVGVEFDGAFYWVTGGHSQTDPNQLYKLRPDGSLVAVYDQPAGCPGWGGRDMAFDGKYLYFGCDDGFIHQIDPLTGAQAGVIDAPISVPRALAYDPATDCFWTANWDSTLYKFNRQGATVASCPPVGRSTYGMAWDGEAPGGPALWLWSQDGPTRALASQLDPDTCRLTGVAFAGLDVLPGDEVAGGAAISADLIPGWRVFVGLHQNGPDILVGYDLGQVSRAFVPCVMR
jgi:hypothetical protein